MGRPAEDNRRFVNGVLWGVRSGMRWENLPERYGKYKSVHKRFARWARAGVWDRIFDDLVADTKNPCLMLDSTIVRAHQQAATGCKRGLRRGGSGASRGGVTTKIHLLAKGRGDPVAFRLTAGQAGEYAGALHLLEGRQAEIVLADKGYDSAAVVVKAWAQEPSTQAAETAKSSAPTAAKSTNSAIASNAASTA